VDWVNSDRSDRGNAHRYRESDATKADAWLAVHVAGALMVRLSNEEPRDIIAAREKRMADAAAAKAEEERLAAETLAAEQAARSSMNDLWGTPSNYNDETPF
jgi:membrane protein involved in colicin uptake